jgi:type VI secretion system secreted protein VgrG
MEIGFTHAAPSHHRLELSVSCSLGDDLFSPIRATVIEGVSELFRIELLASCKKDFNPVDLIGGSLNLKQKIKGPSFGQQIRHFNGIVTEVRSGMKDLRGFRTWTISLRPHLWLLTQRSDHRIWMGKSALDVLQVLLKDHGLPAPDLAGVVGTVPPLHYSVQHGETDFDYLVRRFENAGLFWWFEHKDGHHKLHVANHQSGWLAAAAPDADRILLARGEASETHIDTFEKAYQHIPASWAGRDWNFETPRVDIQATTSSFVHLKNNTRREIYQYPVGSSKVEGAEQAGKLRMQAIESTHHQVRGVSDVCLLEPGRRFQPREAAGSHDRHDPYVIIHIEHEIGTDRSQSNEIYRNRFVALPARLPLTPSISQPQPKISATQIAIIAGPEGEEIHTDEYGRVKLCFPWDRNAKKDGSDTCWVRVAQLWSDAASGMQFIPRIGMEVLVSFVDSDPDKPLVIGAVANKDHMPSYKLPDNKTRTVWRSSSHKGQGFNEISFEDASGHENQFYHAQKDRTERVLHNTVTRVDAGSVRSVGTNCVSEVGGHQKSEIGGSCNLTVGGVGPDAQQIAQNMNSVAKKSASLLKQADGIASGGGSGAFSSSIASGSLGYFDSEGTEARSQVVKGTNPGEDAGTALAASGEKMTTAVTRMFSQKGCMNTVVSAFKSVSVGNASVEQVGHTKITNIGEVAIEHVGKVSKTIVGEELTFEVGESKIIIKSNGDIKISGKSLNLDFSGSIKLTGSRIDLN